MAIYAIGDLQGCYEDLVNLLDKVNFDAQKDTLWFVGDLVNRGPDSLATLRFVKNLGASAKTVLGNHDLHLLATYHGLKRNNDPSIQEILKAPDCDELINWLRAQPLLIQDEQNQFNMVHAGIYPLWTLAQAQQYAHELETVLASDSYLDFLNNMYGDLPNKWQTDLAGWDRLRFICNAFTRMRYCTIDNQLDFTCNSAPGTQKEGLVPWFNIKQRKASNNQIIFGHWSTLGYFKEQQSITLPDNIYPTDTGCVWGGKLSAFKLTNPIEIISINCPNRTKSL